MHVGKYNPGSEYDMKLDNDVQKINVWKEEKHFECHF
jgi:hypothetical protein